MGMRIAAIGCGVLTLAACATDGQGGPGTADPAGECEATEAQPFVGERATPELGEELLRITGAKQLRWGPPRSAMTMDFRPDRLTVSYDDDMVIDRIGCG